MKEGNSKKMKSNLFKKIIKNKWLNIFALFACIFIVGWLFNNSGCRWWQVGDPFWEERLPNCAQY